jgi:diguanylate cyclase (GGDEF)-like protein/PAS domain S-box-containing protein
VKCRIVAWVQAPLGPLDGQSEPRAGAADALAPAAEPDTVEDSRALASFVWDSLTEYAVFTISSAGLIASWNSGAERTFGYSRDEIVGRHFSVIFTPEENGAGMPGNELRRAVADGRVDRDCWHVRRDGTRFWGTNTVQPLLDPHGAQRGFMKVVRDSTERYEAAVALRESEERFRLLVDGVTEYAMFSTGPDGRITLWNSGAERTFGYTTEEIIGESFSKLYAPDDIAMGLPETELAQARKRGQIETERWQVRKDGTRFLALWRLTRLKTNRVGTPSGFAATAHDVTERRAGERAMWDRAFHDALTGLPNRALLTEHLQRAILRTKRHARSRCALLYLDLEDFKAINDDYGHGSGDEVLKEVARRIQACLRPEDVVARLGGDEFCILLADISGPRVANSLAARVHAALSVPLTWAAADRVVSASIGIALGGALYDSADDMLRDADAAMYEAKGRGRRQTVVFDDRLRERGRSRHVLEADIRAAIERDELFLEYQPIVSLRDKRIAGFEALLRWRHPARGVLPPNDFIPIAERTGSIVPIDRWVLATACRQLRAWQQEFAQAGSLTMSVNLSPKQLADPEFSSCLDAILRDSGAPAASLKLEITETAIMGNTDAVLASLAAIRALDVEIQVDDFGTGYSSLSYLCTFPLNTVKLDGSFIAGIEGNEDQTEIVRAIVALAHNLRLTVVAEGVETRGQLSALETLACEFAQGFLFHRPMGADAARNVIAGIGPQT